MDFSTLLLATALYGAPCSSANVPDDYVRDIRIAVQKHWPVAVQPFWCWWVAQVYAESRMDPRARSPVGAIGLTQVIPATGREQAAIEKLSCSLWEPECNIEVGTAYSGRMLRAFTSPRPVLDLLCWEAVSYNAGLGNALESQVEGETENCDEALEVLHKVTGHHATETRGYVARIRRVFVSLLKG